MKGITVAVICLALVASQTAFAGSRTPFKGSIRCNAWCDKCKPNVACYSTCKSTGNLYVNGSCAVRGNG